MVTESTMKKCVLAAALLSLMASHAQADSLPARAPSWTGPYIGANLGWGRQRARTTTSAEPNFPFFPVNSNLLQDAIIPGATTENAHGFLGGVTLGYNLQSGVFVFGLDADWMWTGIRGTSSETRDTGTAGWLATTVTQTKTDWLATLRGRAGVLTSPLLNLYVTGGLAIGHLEGSRSTFTSGAGDCSANHMINFVCSAGSISDTRLGWTAGTGADYKIAPYWTVRAEYLYYDLGQVSYTTNGTTPAFAIGEPRFSVNTKVSGSIVRLGLNYQFGLAP